MQTYLNVPGALYSDGTIPEKDRADARISLVMTLEEALFMEHVLCVAENDPYSGFSRKMRDAIRDMRRSLKLASS